MTTPQTPGREAGAPETAREDLPSGPVLDLDAIREKWLKFCSHDTGLPYPCICPDEDYRPVLGALWTEVETLRADRDRAWTLVSNARAAARRLTSVLIANAHRLDTPFSNATVTPWATSISPAINRLRAGLGMRGVAANCCDMHNRNCEPPSELCCEECSEANHPAHVDGSFCSVPDLSSARMPAPVEDALRDEVERLRAKCLPEWESDLLTSQAMTELDNARADVARLQAERDDYAAQLDEATDQRNFEADRADKAESDLAALHAEAARLAADRDRALQRALAGQAALVKTQDAELAAMRPVVEAADRYIAADADLDEADSDSGEWKAAEQERDHAWDGLLDAHNAYLQKRHRDQMAPSGPLLTRQGDDQGAVAGTDTVEAQEGVQGRTDRDLLEGLARHLRKHDVGCFDDAEPAEQERAEQLIAWFAESVDVLNVPEVKRDV